MAKAEVGVKVIILARTKDVRRTVVAVQQVEVVVEEMGMTPKRMAVTTRVAVRPHRRLDGKRVGILVRPRRMPMPPIDLVWQGTVVLVRVVVQEEGVEGAAWPRKTIVVRRMCPPIPIRPLLPPAH